jgi:cysteine-rich repeat protein
LRQKDELSMSLPSRTFVAIALTGAAGTLGGCINTFDPMLYMGGNDAGPPSPDAFLDIDAAEEIDPDAFVTPDAAMDAAGADAFEPADAGSDVGPIDGGPPVFTLSDYCMGTVPELVVSAASRTIAIDTTTLRDDGSMDIAMCLGDAPSGPDGFFRVTMTAGERWHFHYRHVGDVDPALYIVDTCDLRTCRDNQVIDLCSNGADEHLTFQPTAGGTYFIGVDSYAAGGLTGTMEVYRPVCGNGMREHSETCDVGDVVPGDGCDEQCRDEITDTPTNRGELEVNDDPFSANHILYTVGARMLVTGRIATACETDWYVVDLAAMGSIAAELRTMSDAACTGSLDVPDPFSIELIASDGLTRLGTGAFTAGCPAIDPARDAFARNLPAGRYFLRLFGGVEAGRRFDYAMGLTVTTP